VYPIIKTYSSITLMLKINNMCTLEYYTGV